MESFIVYKHHVLMLLISRWEMQYGRISPDQLVRLQDLWTILPLDGSFELLRMSLSPILSKSPKKQVAFYNIFHEIVVELQPFYATALEAAPHGNAIQHPKQLVKEENQSLLPLKENTRPSFWPISKIKKSKLVIDWDNCINPPFTWNIAPEENISTSIDLENEAGFETTVMQMRQSTQNPINKLDIHATVKDSVLKAGMPVFRYLQQAKVPEYLLLVERYSQNDHRAGLFDFFYQTLKINNVFVDRFFYDGDLRICRNDRYPYGINLRELHSKFPQTRLIVLGNGHRMIGFKTGLLSNWTSLLTAWQVRVLLTPIPKASWGHYEAQLSKVFTLLPAALQSFQYISGSTDIAAVQYDALPDYIRRIAEVEPIEIESPIIRSLRGHFDHDMLCWIAGCAIYPALHYSLTLQIGCWVSEIVGRTLVTANNLIDLTRIYWFTDGKIEPEFRDELLGYLVNRHPHIHIELLNRLLKLMEDNPPPVQSVAWAEHQINLALLKLRLNETPDDATASQLRAVVKRLGRPERMGDFILPERWEEVIRRIGGLSDEGEDDFKETLYELIPQETKEAGYANLESIVGRIKTKAQIRNFLQQITQENDENIEKPKHFILTGNAGTGKNTIARIIAQLLLAEGSLRNSHLVAVSATELLSPEIMPAQLIKDWFNASSGGILIVNDFDVLTDYLNMSLGGEYPTTSWLESFFDAVNNTIEKVIFIGIARKSINFSGEHQVLTSLIGLNIYLKDYTPKELVNIFEYKVHLANKQIAISCKEALRNYFLRFSSSKTVFFDNGHLVARLFLRINTVHDERCKKQGLDPEQEQLQLQDTLGEFVVHIPPLTTHDEADEIQDLVGLEKAKSQIFRYLNTILLENASSRERLPFRKKDIKDLNLVFYGNVGTGKSTMARILSEVFLQCKILTNKRTTLVEVSRNGLVGFYQGQTTQRVLEKCRAANGGVLVVKNACDLVYDPSDRYGKEALDAIIQYINEEKENSTSIIFTGKKEKMVRFFEDNPSLKELFSTKIEFEDYNGLELFEIFRRLLAANKYNLDASANIVMHAIFEKISQYDKDKYQNAKESEKVVEMAIMIHNTLCSQKGIDAFSEPLRYEDALAIYEELWPEEIEKTETQQKDDIDKAIGNDFPKYLTVIPSYNVKEILGREAEVKRIHDMFFRQSLNCCVVYGATGIGKTSTVLKFINTHENKFDHILWLDLADNTKEILSLPVEINWREGIEYSSDFKLSFILDYFKKSGKKLLVVLENVTVAALNEIVDFGGGTHSSIIATARLSFEGFESVKIEKLPIIFEESIKQATKLQQNPVESIGKKGIAVRCSRCNEIKYGPEKCGRFDCGISEYYNVYTSRFKRNLPQKYYVSITGGINSGRTYYITELIEILLRPDELTQRTLFALGIKNCSIIDPNSIEIHTSLMEEYKSREIFLTLRLSYINLILTTIRGEVFEIVLYNTPGEKIESEYDLKKYRTDSHDLKGSVVLSFIDPREDSKLNSQLENPKINQPCSNLSIPDHLFKILQTINPTSKKIHNPIAICISKFDLLASRIPYDIPVYPYVEHKNDSQDEDVSTLYFKEIEDTSEKLAAFLQNSSQTVDPRDLSEKFSNIEYFAVAPYGNDIKPANYVNREPKGILPPFLWALKSLKIIP